MTIEEQGGQPLAAVEVRPFNKPAALAWAMMALFLVVFDACETNAVQDYAGLLPLVGFISALIGLMRGRYTDRSRVFAGVAATLFIWPGLLFALLWMATSANCGVYP